MQQIRARQLADWLSDDSRSKPVLLDVREPWEFELCRLPDSLHIPMHLVPLRSNELKRDDDIVIICHHGRRSMQVAMFLERQGYSSLINLTGGVFVNQSAAFSDYHGTGGNPATNASYCDSAFVANRFRVVQRRSHV